MKILYALPATGNGHLSRAISIYPYLSSIGKIDFLISGQNSSLVFPYPVKYRCNGVSLYYNTNGGINLWKTISNINLQEIDKYCSQVEVNNYDLIISDFEPISAWACKKRNVSFVHWGHQASFSYLEVPRPNDFLSPGRWVLENYVKSQWSYGLHFKAFNNHIGLPIIKEKIFYSDRVTSDIITVYLPQYNIYSITQALKNIKGINIQIFHQDIQNYSEVGRLQFYPINNKNFTESLIQCRLLICGGGFESPSEAMYLNKRMICIPIQNHFEQRCNAMVLDQMGVVILRHLKELTNELIHKQFQTYGLSEYNFVGISAKNACLEFFNYWESHRSNDVSDEVEILCSI